MTAADLVPSSIIGNARSQGRVLLTEIESKQILDSVGIVTAEARLAPTADDAAAFAAELGFPVALKVVSPQVAHKSDVGGVRLGLQTKEAVRSAFSEIEAGVRNKVPDAEFWGVAVQRMAPPGTEVILGISTDPQLGPVLMFGLGGVWVELLKDVVFRIAPLEPDDARAMIREIKAFPLLQGFRGTPPADIATLEGYLMRLSALAEQHPEIMEVDLNPVFVYEQGAIAADARILLQPR